MRTFAYPHSESLSLVPAIPNAALLAPFDPGRRMYSDIWLRLRRVRSNAG